MRVLAEDDVRLLEQHIQLEREIQRGRIVGEEYKTAETELTEYYSGLQTKVDVGELEYEEAVAAGQECLDPDQ